MSQCASWKQDRSVPKLWGLSISHICVAQPASALSVCQAENQALWNPSCSQLCCPGTQVWTKFRLEKMRNCSEPSAGVIHGKTQVPALQQTQPGNYTPGTTGITAGQEPPVLSEPLLCSDRNSCCRAKHYSHNLKQNICVFLLQHFKYFLCCKQPANGINFIKLHVAK